MELAYRLEIRGPLPRLAREELRRRFGDVQMRPDGDRTVGLSMLAFVELSMLVAALRADDGCEVLAVPNLSLLRGDAIWCPLYTPIDAKDESR